MSCDFREEDFHREFARCCFEGKVSELLVLLPLCIYTDSIISFFYLISFLFILFSFFGFFIFTNSSLFISILPLLGAIWGYI